MAVPEIVQRLAHAGCADRLLSWRACEAARSRLSEPVHQDDIDTLVFERHQDQIGRRASVSNESLSPAYYAASDNAGNPLYKGIAKTMPGGVWQRRRLLRSLPLARRAVN